nr:carbohydrate binding family 9 domain-containing protein [Acidobacteriota bacterium]
ALVLPPEKANPLRVPRLEKPPVIDGRLDDDAWKGAAVLKDFYQVEPGDNTAPSKPTEVLIGYDTRFLYVAFHAYDERDKVRATIAKRDAIFDDDYVGLFFDTFNDKRKAYEMNFNPLGVQADGVLTAGINEDFSVDMVVESKGSVVDDGYIVEVAIPFKSLRYEAGKDVLWGVHFYRRIKRFNNELDMWMPISRDISNWLAQAGHITGLEGISTERTLEVIPSLTLSETGKRKSTIPSSILSANRGMIDPGKFVNEPVKFDPGVTVKYGITPTVTLDFALNPDFAQVEADQTVVTANQRFPIFFEEKRPFFLEGIDIFRTQILAVHTRSIVDPDIAAKLTGKLGRNSFGLLLASDNAPGNFSRDELSEPDFFRRNERFVDKNAYIGVLRLKRDVGKENSIGFLATTYNFIEKHNQLAGFDGRFKLNKVTTFDVQVLGSTSRFPFYNPDLNKRVYRTGNGFIYAYALNNDGRHFGFNYSGVGRTRDYRSDVGFNRRTNTNLNELFLRYNSEPNPKARLISWRFYNNINTNFDFQGRMQRWNDDAQIRFNFPLQSFLAFAVQGGYERVFEEEFGPRRNLIRSGQFAGEDSERSAYRKGVYMYGGTTPSKKYSIFVFVARDWGILDFDFGAGPRFPRVSPGALVNSDARQDPGSGNGWHVESNLVYQPTDTLRFSLDYNKDRLVRNDTGRVAFDDNIFALRGTYQFTRFTFARARIDYDTLAASVRGQFLLGWAPNPGTAFYAGYNDDLNLNGFNRFSNNLEPGFRRNGRTFFIKMSYLFRRSF